MKRILSLVLALLLLCALAGCDTAADGRSAFFYLRPRDAYAYGSEEAVVACEMRTFAVPVDDQQYLLQLYLDGPVSDQLENPFPQGTQLLSFQRSGHTLTIKLSEEFAALDGIRLTLACACLSNTCFRMTDADNLIILAKDKVYTYSRESFLFCDSSTAPAQ